jgi:hypothetical protein
MSINSGDIPRNISATSRHQVIKRARSACSNEERDRIALRRLDGDDAPGYLDAHDQDSESDREVMLVNGDVLAAKVP